jgi:sn-glycerol 3-phosphate transport system ATP-binding protein
MPRSIRAPIALSLRNLCKSFGQQAILQDISLDVAKGEFIALLGPSGCGKSTLLRLIAGLESADSGGIFIDSHDVQALSPSQRKLSMVFQSYALFPHLNVERNVSFGLEVRGVPREERARRVAEALATTGLQGLEKRKPAALSGGQRQRVALARAIVGGHALCLMDEPLSNLDAKLRHAVRHELRTLQRTLGITVIYVTHDQTEAMGMADRVVLMNAGRIEQCDTPEALYSAPSSTYVAAFIGSPPMMLLPESSVPFALRALESHASPATARQYGVRPEDFEITEPGEHTVNGRITALEFQGADFYVYVTTQFGDPLIVRSKSQTSPLALSEHQMVGLTWRRGAGHVFSAETGHRIEHLSSAPFQKRP